MADTISYFETPLEGKSGISGSLKAVGKIDRGVGVGEPASGASVRNGGAELRR